MTMEKTFQANARNLAFHLANLSKDYDKAGYEGTASALRQASLTIKLEIAFNNLKMKG
jgi:hypothetical protein